MFNDNLRERRQFFGCLKTEAFTVLKNVGQGISYQEKQVEAFEIPVNFRAHINSSGEIEFEFDPISITKENRYLLDYLLPRGTGLSYFSIVGKSDDGTELEIERIHFSSELFYDEEKQEIVLSRGTYPKAKLTRNLSETNYKQVIRMWLIGFNRSHPLMQDCHLGSITLIECPPDKDSDDLTGLLQIEAKNELSDKSDWHQEATKLLEHVRLVMSFASGLMLHAQIVEFYAGDKLSVDVLSQIRQVSTTSFPVFQSYDRGSIFEAAVNSFFVPPFRVKNLFIAIEWFVMSSSYREVRLVNAMTVLENLVSSNLEEDDIWRIPDQKEFKKYKKSLEKDFKQIFEDRNKNKENQEITLPEIYENLANLNRRSLRQKIDILANRWSISLEDISETQIQAMIKARNLIVHEGHYNTEHTHKLWEHAMVARELVIRFIFRAVGYEGSYISHIENYHSAYFPHKTNA